LQRWNRQADRRLSGQQDQEAIMSDHWQVTTDRLDIVSDSGEDEAAYATGWTISGLATLGVIVAVWMFGI
jgi:hypothetical protein